MDNKKVFLAKSILASGLDVEYVKSNLQRIEGIELVEVGMGIEPEECAALVIVPGPKEYDPCEESVIIGKNISKLLNNFIDVNNYSEVYFFVGKDYSNSNDVEDTIPTYVVLDYLDEDELEDKNDNVQERCFVSEGCYHSLLETIVYDIGSSDNWSQVPRHHQPAPEYSMPPIPSYAQRRVGITSDTKNKDPYPYAMPGYEISNVSNNMSLLLLRRKK